MHSRPRKRAAIAAVELLGEMRCLNEKNAHALYLFLRAIQTKHPGGFTNEAVSVLNGWVGLAMIEPSDRQKLHNDPRFWPLLRKTQVGEFVELKRLFKEYGVQWRNGFKFSSYPTT